MSTKIEWTDNGETWNPIAGCDKISAGCKNCYAIKDAHRLAGNPNPKIAEKYAGTTKIENGKMNWTGRINFASEEVLTQPMRWTRPRKIFVNSMSDLFHESVPDEWIDKIFAVMALSPQHIFQGLTKRPERMRGYFQQPHGLETREETIIREAIFLSKETGKARPAIFKFPLPNAHLGISVENQKAADERIPILLETPAKVRWLSVEPLLEEIDLSGYLPFCLRHRAPQIPDDCLCAAHDGTEWRKPDWVVVGGESGANARPVNQDWVRSIRDQCVSVGIPFFFKQWGGANKKNAGRILDGRTWDEFPKENKL